MKLALGCRNRTENRFSHTRLPEFIAPGRDEWQSGKVTWQSTFLCGANLDGADLSYADLSNADLNFLGDLIHTSLRKTNLSHANLSGAGLGQADLSGADLSQANLSGAYLGSWANLSGVDLSHADLSRADLSHADLGRADLSHADLGQADLRSANLSWANLSWADLRYASLGGASLYGADLTNAKVGWTNFANNDLRIVKGLLEINHEGPSLVALYSLKLPQDGRMLHFLQSTGVPDEWIDDYRAHMMHPIQYHSCFISYSSKDETLAKRLHADLQDHGVRCWFAPHDMKIGDKIRSRIDEAICVHEKLLLLLSEHSLASQWVEQEVETALEKERRAKRTVLFPIRLDNTLMEIEGGWPALIRNTRHIGNFTCWKDHDIYQKALERLLRDLKTETAQGEK